MVLSWSTPAAGAELSAEQERGVQVAGLATAYSFAAFHTVLLGVALREGEALPRSWVPGTLLTTVSLVGSTTGFWTLAAEAETGDEAALSALAPIPGVLLGAGHLALAIDSMSRGPGGFWMEPLPAAITLVHGASLTAFGVVLVAAPNSGSSDLSKIVPLYSWTVAGSAIALHSILSLALFDESSVPSAAGRFRPRLAVGGDRVELFGQF